MFGKTGKDLFSSVVEPFLKNAEESIPLLHAAIEQGNFKGLYETAHRLKGGSRNLGLRKISEICSGLIDNAQLSCKKSVTELVCSLEMEIPLVWQQVLVLREKGPSGIDQRGGAAVTGSFTP